MLCPFIEKRVDVQACEEEPSDRGKISPLCETTKVYLHIADSFNNLVLHILLEMLVALDAFRQTWHLTCHKALHVLFIGTYL